MLDRNKNNLAIDDAAANLFWMLAEKVGVSGANTMVIESSGHCLLNQPFTVAVLAQYGFHKLISSDQQAFASMVADEAERFAIGGMNMNGVIYAEDIQIGRSPAARNVDTSVLRAIPKRVFVGDQTRKVGVLCLRHPLPAVVFVNEKIQDDFIEVADTTAALGFHLPIFLGISGNYLACGNLFALTGIFHIPVPNVGHGNLWNRAIQNSLRFVSELTFLTPGKTHDIRVEW
ncbi:MAG: hypothetical protein ACYDHY_09980 [Acidiferrobacterales bacterium]